MHIAEPSVGAGRLALALELIDCNVQRSRKLASDMTAMHWSSVAPSIPPQCTGPATERFSVGKMARVVLIAIYRQHPIEGPACPDNGSIPPTRRAMMVR
jgi:hypothetical protein